MWPCSPPSIASPSGMLIGMGGVAMVFSGGGAPAAYFGAGVVRAVEEAGLEPTMFSGVSSGAFNAAPERVELGVGAGTEDGGVDEQLDLTGAVAQHGEGEPTLPAQQREPAGDPHAVIGDLVRAEPGVRGPDLLDRVVGGVAVRQPPVDVGVGRHDPHIERRARTDRSAATRFSVVVVEAS
ncbi:MAG: patatin-like phospholipase family protein [Pseudonocardiales bacterium]|nr:patatin-like phospholipase family protein [Pseudonocardiales bacterium]